MDVRSVVVEERTAVNSIPILSSESVSVIESIVLRRCGRLVERAWLRCGGLGGSFSSGGLTKDEMARRWVEGCLGME